MDGLSQAAALPGGGAGPSSNADPGAGAPDPRRRAALEAEIDRLIAAIDRAVSDQVDAILRHPRFRRMEASWRSLRLLVEAADGISNVRVRVLHATWGEICRDFERASDFDQSALFARVYSDEFGMPGGEPFGMLVGDYEIRHLRGADDRTDVAALAGLAAVAAAAFAPVVMGCAPELLELERFSAVTPTLDFSTAFQGERHRRWRALQEQEDSRFLGLALPRVLVRPPYADDGSRRDGFRFRDEEGGPEGRGGVWGNPGYALAAVVLRAFANHGWLADIRGARADAASGGVVTHLPRADFPTDRPGVAPRVPVEVALTERQEHALCELGLIPLVRARETPYCVFNTVQSVQRPRSYVSPAASTNARLSAMLSAILCVSRFAHYVKVLARDRVGSFSTAEECRAWLEDWLRGYVVGNDEASVETKARYPLRAAAVEVTEPPGRPGVFDCAIHLQPHFQFEHAVSSFRLTTRIASRASR
ncbi:type VI secretion system contractile sheath large subunit [Arenibaculum pallidiluteum]|uniref:type VI secretion system contractile sheath large subunit n=1 Tax=Arenibaculum pallidiluteum TaxID=2812559 RepID=UPI001A972002|nr:type VI secretion system contractile sheath large subunit [Arenibaculum pallidiluteum]